MPTATRDDTLAARIASGLGELRQVCNSDPFGWEPLVDELDELIDRLPPSGMRDLFREELERCRRDGELTQSMVDIEEDLWMSEETEWARQRRERFELSRDQLIDRAQRKANELKGRGGPWPESLRRRIREARHDLAAEHRTSTPPCTLTRSRERGGRAAVRHRGSRRSPPSSGSDPDESDSASHSPLGGPLRAARRGAA